MDRRIRSVPRYRKHKASGQAIVTLSGQMFYLGHYGTKTSKAEYDRQVAEWLARGRQPLNEEGGEPSELPIVELIVRFKEWAEGHYICRRGKVANEVTAILSATKILRELYGREPANSFGPLKLKAVRERMIQAGWSRGHINEQVSRIRRMFRWGVGDELVRAEVHQALEAVRDLAAGRCEARETSPVLPVADATVNLTLDCLPPLVADMVRLQRLTGCRPEEVCNLKPCQVDTTGEVWSYRPPEHKTKHQGRERVIFIGPKGQAILRPYLLREKGAYCFVPAESEKKRREAAHEECITPLKHGNRPGSNRKPKPARAAGQRYTTDSYRRAITRACELDFDMPSELREAPPDETPEQLQARRVEAAAWREVNCWAPNQLRHSKATEIRKRFGLEAPAGGPARDALHARTETRDPRRRKTAGGPRRQGHASFRGDA